MYCKYKYLRHYTILINFIQTFKWKCVYQCNGCIMVLVMHGCVSLLVRLTGLFGGVFHEQRRYVLVHAHLVLGDARVGAGVFIPHTADIELTAIGWEDEKISIHSESHWEMFFVIQGLPNAFRSFEIRNISVSDWLPQVETGEVISIGFGIGFDFKANFIDITFHTQSSPGTNMVWPKTSCCGRIRCWSLTQI